METTVTTTQTSNSLSVPRVSDLELRMDDVKYPRIGHLPEAQVITALAAIVGEAKVLLGQKVDNDEVKTIAVNFHSALVEDGFDLGLMSLSLEEIRRIIRKAALGRSEVELYGVSVASLFNAVATWAKGEGAGIQAEARRQARIQREAEERKYIEQSGIGAMLKVNIGKLLTNKL